jgi:alkanesulfonate monooxygenase SsuD/methylene tetrahydromethanopterin reductase-like flavin-dependent oxidoreductase (luciferase family)
MAQKFEFGLDTFGDVTIAPDGKPLTHAQVIRNVVDEGVLADELGIDAFGVGEHHRPDFSVSAPEVVLAAIAGRTKRIRLGSAVTVLSSDDPIRVSRAATTAAAGGARPK